MCIELISLHLSFLRRCIVSCTNAIFASCFVGAIVRNNGEFGIGSGPILLDYVRCTGLEYRLLDCLHRGIEVESCTHSSDAGVSCMAGNDLNYSIRSH